MSWDRLIAESKFRTVRWTAALLVVGSLGACHKPIENALGKIFNENLSLYGPKATQKNPADKPVTFEDFDMNSKQHQLQDFNPEH